MARTVFGATVAVLLAVAGLPLGLSLAQVTPTIQIINPHTGVSTEVSDKEQPYHLNSWVNVVPPSPLVEYELDVTTIDPIFGSSTDTVTLGEATQEGNAFGFPWDISNDLDDMSDDPTIELQYTLRAVLYTGFTGPGTGVEVSRDEQEITINHQNDASAAQSTEDAAETVTITYPTNGGPLGVYIRPDGTGGNFTIDAIVSKGAGSPDPGTRFVRPYYTISEFGEEPVWKTCGGYSGTTNNDDGTRTARVRCSTADGDYALDVTGVALVTNDQPQGNAGQAQPQFNDSSDALAVVPYYQTVSSLTVEPATTNGAPDNDDCVQLVAIAVDQNQRPIGNMNIDVMAQGPSDQLKFDTYTGSSSVSDANQPPDKGHSGNGDPGIACFAGAEDGQNGQQADHNLPGGPDIKHVESTGGTDSSGEFEFALATDRPGGTQITAYADEVDDDKLCSGEKSDNASIGWEQQAPAPSGFAAETDSCTIVTPSPTPTPTESGSSSPPPSSGTQEPKERHDRDITIRFAHGSLIVSGRVSVDDGTARCHRRVPVKVQKLNRKVKKWVTKKQTITNRSGNYSVAINDKTGKYRAAAIKTKKGADRQHVCLYVRQNARHRH